MHHGDHVRGELSPTAKLTAAAVLRIRERHDAGEGEPVGKLAREFGITPSQATMIVTGRSWAHVGGPVREVQSHRITRVGSWFCPLDGCELETDTTRNGAIVTRCRGCERRRAGRCMDCGTKVAGRAWRCPIHRRIHQNRLVRECDQRHRDEYRRANRKRYFGDPANRQRKLDYKKEWRQRNRKKVLLQKRRARLRGCGGYATREKYLAYHAAYRERNRERHRAHARAQYYREHPERPSTECVVCGADVGYTGRGRPSTLCPTHRHLVWLSQRRLSQGYAA